MIVLDASVALAWCLKDESSAYADEVAGRVTSEGALVPSIWALEVGNALVSAERQGRLTDLDRRRLTEVLAALPVEVEPTSLRQALGPIADFASRHRLSSYDAAYLELAHRLGLPLATRDERLGSAASAAGVQVIAASAD